MYVICISPIADECHCNFANILVYFKFGNYVFLITELYIIQGWLFKTSYLSNFFNSEDKMKCLKRKFCDRDNDFDKACLRFELIEHDFLNKTENVFQKRSPIFIFHSLLHPWSWMTMTIEIVLRRIITVKVQIYIVLLKKMKVTFEFSKLAHLTKSFDHYVMALGTKQPLF